MPETAAAQVARLVQLVAWMSQRDTPAPVAYRAAAKHLGVPEATVRSDLNALVRLTDEYKPWLASLSVAFTATGFALESKGPFRRPFRLTGDETIALVLGLADVRGGERLAAKLGASLAKTPAAARAPTSVGLGPTPSAHVEEMLTLARQARDERRRLELMYCGSNGEARRRVVDCYQVVQRLVWWYVIAWCEDANGYRHFRLDRILAAQLLAGQFTPRGDFQPIARAADVFRSDATITATVAFSRRIARWLREKYPNGRSHSDGHYVVAFRVADPAWFVREILQYGAEAEVLEPASLREAVKRTVNAAAS